MKIRAIRVGSAVKYGALFSAVYALLTGIPSAVATIAIQRLVITLLAPVIRLFHGSVAGAISSATTITLLLLLCYVLATMLFVIIFTALATLAYNLVARFTGGLTLEIREVGKKREGGPPQEVIHETADGVASKDPLNRESTVEEVGKKMEDEAASKEIPAATEDPVSERNSPR